MPKFIISLGVQITSETSWEAESVLREFLTNVSQYGKPLKYGISDVRLVAPPNFNED